MTRFVRGVAAPIIRGFRGRGWFARLLVGLAALALLTPSLAAVQPGLVGWSASHGHVYDGSLPVDHAHPWDDTSEGADHQGVTFTWDDASTVFAVTVPLAVGVAVVATLLFALDRLRPQEPRSAFTAVLTPPPR